MLEKIRLQNHPLRLDVSGRMGLAQPPQTFSDVWTSEMLMALTERSTMLRRYRISTQQQDTPAVM